jgi:hypothetical protein
MKNFDEFIAIDWSGALKPIHTESIAVARCQSGSKAPALISPKNHKFWSRDLVADFILSLPSEKRYLIGIDCNFGYAVDIVRQQIPGAKSAKDLWALVDDICRDDENFSAQSFWTHPVYKKFFWTQGLQPHNFTLKQRHVEQQCARMGLGAPESPFKLIGAKQVGKGGLNGMRLVHYLQKTLKKRIAIWPFDTKAVCEAASIVVTEIYPRLFLKLAHHGNRKVRDAQDLNRALGFLGAKPLASSHMTDHAADALVSAAGLRFMCGKNQQIQGDFLNPSPREVIACEGWIWGVPVAKNQAE